MKNYWPFGIFLLAMAVVALIALTIRVAILNPVEPQGICQQNSQYIDEHSNAIAQMRARLLERYEISFEGALQYELKDFHQLFLHISDKANGNSIVNAEVMFFLTRPNTTREDKNLGTGKFVDRLWQSEYFDVSKQGRYQGEAFVKIGNDSICVTQEYFVKGSN